MLEKSLKRKDNELNLTYDLFIDEEENTCVLDDWKSLKRYIFATVDECYAFIEDRVPAAYAELFREYRTELSATSSISLGEDEFADMQKRADNIKKYQMFKETTRPCILEVLDDLERKYYHRLSTDPLFGRFCKPGYLPVYFDDYFYPVTDDGNRYSVYSWHTKDGRTFLVEYCIGEPTLVGKSVRQKTFWDMLMEHYESDYRLEESDLTLIEAIILKERLEYKYTEKGEYIFGFASIEHRKNLDPQYYERRTRNHIYIDEFYYVFFPEIANTEFCTDKPTVEDLSVIAFVTNGVWSKEYEAVKDWVLASNGIIRKGLCKSTKAMIINEKRIKLQDYLKCKRQGCKVFFIDDVLKLCKSISQPVCFEHKKSSKV